MENSHTIIPAYVSEWTDKYFHHSAFDVPLNFPSQKVIEFLSKFKKDKKIKLFRGINKFNEKGLEISSWTYSKKIANGYAGDNGKIIEKTFNSKEIVLDMTLLNKERRIALGYDYKVNDKEVLILSN